MTTMSHVDSLALARIKRLVSKGCVWFTLHARQRMDERNISEPDVIAALMSARDAKHALPKDNYLVTGGCDLDGDPMTVVVAIEANVVIITLY